MTVEVFDHNSYRFKQIVDALTCPINRHGTRVEHGLDDWGLWRNSQLLIDHYIKFGGADAWAKRRNEFLRTVTVPDEPEFYI